MNKSVDLKNPIALHKAGIDALVQELGGVGAIRFLQLFDKGSGDYTKEKYERDEMSIDEIADAISRMRRQEEKS